MCRICHKQVKHWQAQDFIGKKLAARANSQSRLPEAVQPLSISGTSITQMMIISLMRDVGIDTSHIAKGDTPTGHAIVIIEDKTAENQILLMQGANITITPQMIDDALVCWPQ